MDDWQGGRARTEAVGGCEVGLCREGVTLSISLTLSGSEDTRGN